MGCQAFSVVVSARADVAYISTVYSANIKLVPFLTNNNIPSIAIVHRHQPLRIKSEP